MNNNIIPALIIAGAVIAAGVLLRPNPARQFDSVLTQLEDATQKKDASGKTRLARIFQGASQSATGGLSAGLGSGTSDKPSEELVARDKIVVRGVRIVPSQSKNQERVIGVLRNTGDLPISNVRLNVVFTDRAGEVIDVSSKFSQVQGVLKPGEEIGFEVDRGLGDFNEKPDVLSSRKANAAKVTVVGVQVLKGSG